MFRSLFFLVLLVFALPLQGADRIRGHYEVIGQVPNFHSIQKVVFEEFMNFGCPHCNNLRKASLTFRKQQKDRVEFHDIPITFQGQDDAPLRLFYVARKQGKGDLIKNELFKASFIHGVDVVCNRTCFYDDSYERTGNTCIHKICCHHSISDLFEGRKSLLFRVCQVT